jgi:hypothetical protein
MPTHLDPRAAAFAYQSVRSACRQATEGGKMQDATVTGARKVAANKPANRPNKPETARFRPDFAGGGTDPLPRLSSAPRSPTTAPLSGR